MEIKFLPILVALAIISTGSISIAANIGHPNWNIEGNWTYSYYLNGFIEPHSMVINVFHPDSGLFRGYIDDPSLLWFVYGIVEENSIKFQIIHMTGNTSYYTDAIGTISSNISMSGDAISPGEIARWDAQRMNETDLENEIYNASFGKGFGRK